MNLISNKYIFSNSRLNTYIECPANYYLKYIRNIVSKKTSINLLYGSVVHKMLEIFYLVFLKTQSEDKAYKAAKKTLMALYNKKELEHKYKTIETALKFLKDIIKFKLHLRGKVTPERLLIKPLSSNIDYQGRIDLTIERPNYCAIYDFKTTSQMGDFYFINLEMSRQFKGYVFLSDLLALGLIPLHCIATPKAYAPYIYEYKQKEIDLWKIETKSIISAILTRHKNLHRVSPHILFPRVATNCTGYYGCGYLPICKNGDLTKQLDGFISYKKEI